MNKKQIRIVVAATKGFGNYKILSEKLDGYLDQMSPVYRKNVEFVTGSEGVLRDLLEQYTLDNGHQFREYEAYWDKNGDDAWYYRNNAMLLHASKGIGVLFIFWDGKSISVKNLVELAQHYGVEIHVEKY